MRAHDLIPRRRPPRASAGPRRLAPTPGRDRARESRVRDAWIEYGRRLSECPHTQRRQVGEWVRAEGLDFIKSSVTRSQALALFNFRTGPNVNILARCQYGSPGRVLKWLKANGHLPPQRPPAASA